MPRSYQLFKFEHRHKNRLEDLQMIRADLQRAVQCVQVCVGPPQLASHALVFATALQIQALVSYVRCFSTGRRTALTRELFKLKPQFESAHDEFKKLRDQHVTHQAGPREHNELIVAAKSEDSAAHGVGLYNFFFASFAAKDLKRFLALLLYVDKAAESEEIRLGDEMAREMIGPRSSWKKAGKAFADVIHHGQIYPTKRSRKR